jgi:hypothetical protein
MTGNAPPLTIRDVLEKRGVLACVDADVFRRVDVALRFGLAASALSRQRTADVHEVGRRIQRGWPSERMRSMRSAA